MMQIDDPADRSEAWRKALDSDQLPAFVKQRLADAGSGNVPWLSTMTPAELLTARSHGVRPVATVSGTCWYHYGFSWTNGHAEGWHIALARMQTEAALAGANAIVDVKLRTVRPGGRGNTRDTQVATSMDFTVVGTAVRIDGLEPSANPIVATVSTLEFVRLLEAGIVPVGLAIGACYDWLTPTRLTVLTGGYSTTMNTHWRELSTFWEQIRDQAIADLRRDTQTLGNGVLAHTHFGEILKQEPTQDGQPPRYLGRWIVIGTAVDTPFGYAVPHDIVHVVDMRDDLSPLRNAKPRGHAAYSLDSEHDGGI